MSKSTNIAILFGNVGGEPETRTLENGVKVSTFSLATSTGGYKTRDGKDVPEVTQWHRCVAWRGVAELCEKYVHKGDRLHVIGTIAYREYEKDGAKRYVTEISVTDINLCGKSDSSDSSSPVPSNEPSDVGDVGGAYGDLPF